MDNCLVAIVALPLYFVVLYISARLVTYAYFRSRIQVAGMQLRKDPKWRAGSSM